MKAKQQKRPCAASTTMQCADSVQARLLPVVIDVIANFLQTAWRVSSMSMTAQQNGLSQALLLVTLTFCSLSSGLQHRPVHAQRAILMWTAGKMVVMPVVQSFDSRTRAPMVTLVQLHAAHRCADGFGHPLQDFTMIFKVFSRYSCFCDGYWAASC